MIEIARSFSRKVNTGNYETKDYFCSAKEECEEKDMSATSEKLFMFCQTMVEADIEVDKDPNKPIPTFKSNTKPFPNKEDSRNTDEMGDDLKAEQ